MQSWLTLDDFLLGFRPSVLRPRSVEHCGLARGTLRPPSTPNFRAAAGPAGWAVASPRWPARHHWPPPASTPAAHAVSSATRRRRRGGERGRAGTGN